MSGVNSDQLHRSTLGIYTSLIDQFNPSLQKLVSLGNSYMQAFQALAAASEAYFNALSKIGEQAFHSVSSRAIGDVLVQISENQKRLTMELEGMFGWFHKEVLQEIDNNVRLDKDYISSSRRRYELEVRSQATALERQLRRGANQDGSEYIHFLRECHVEAVMEEERRYRFLAEKHCGLSQSIVHLMNKTGGALLQKAETWRDELNSTRNPNAREVSRLDGTIGAREDERGGFDREDQLLGRVPSRAPSPQGIRSRSGSVAESTAGGGGGRSVRALVNYQPDISNPTMLHFSRGEMISVLVPQPQNGWLYGRAEYSSQKGWFPASYVEAVDDAPKIASSSDYYSASLRSNNSVAPPPPPPLMSSVKQSEMRPATPTNERMAESKLNSKGSQENGSRPDRLFPKGSNPFATVKLKPASTNDRSAPRLYR